MNNTQNKKITQVTDDTLIVGVDIGSESHWARAILARGYEVSKKPFHFDNTEEGFERFVTWAYGLEAENKLKKIVIACEPTGHYWFNLYDFLKKYDVKLVLVAPQHVKHSKEMDDNTQRKDDRKDPIVIAKLVPEGRYMEPYIPEGIYAELRAAFNRRCDLSEALTRNSNRMTRWFDVYFPEYRTVFKGSDALSGYMVLKRAPLPADILELGVKGICQIWREAKLRGAGEKRAQKLVDAATQSIGLKGGPAVRQELWQLIEERELLDKQHSDIMALIEEILKQIPGADRLLSVPGAGVVTVAGFLSEVGDINRFSDPKQIQKLAGLAVVENSSGKRKGLPGISRRGRSRLRWVLYLAAMSMVKHNKEMKTYHRYYTTRKKNPLKKIQSLMAIAGRIARIFYGILKNGTDYDPMIVMRDFNKEKATA
jgi:transposase